MIDSNYRSLVATAAFAAAVAAGAVPATAATTQMQDAAMTKLAASVISDANQAHATLGSNDTSMATTDIDHALAARMQLANDAKAAGLPLIVPVYAELDDAAVLSNAVKAKKAGTKEPQTVRGNLAEFTSLAIDLDKAKAHLDAAKTAIGNKNMQGARDSLASIGDTLVETTVVTDLPLLTAREDLARAQRELNANDQAAAMSDLHQASRSLRMYENGPHAGDAKKLAAQIDTSASASPSPSFRTDVANWWDSVKAWFAKA